jgi:hypothetical protein
MDSLVTAASQELEKMIADLIPEGKVGAAVSVVDNTGVRVGIAMKHGNHFTTSGEVLNRWTDLKKTEFSFKVRAVW